MPLNFIERLLSPVWDEVIVEKLGKPALKRFGVVRDPDSPDEEMDYALIFFPQGRANASTCMIVKTGSEERMENLIEDLRVNGSIPVPTMLLDEIRENRISLKAS